MEKSWKYVKKLENPMVVREYLEEHNIKLPEILVNCIEKYNGGRPENKVIRTSTNGEHVFKTLLSYNHNDKETIYGIYPELFRDTNLFPVASDAAGNYICYDLVDGKYVFYNHEIDEVEDITEMTLLS